MEKSVIISKRWKIYYRSK